MIFWQGQGCKKCGNSGYKGRLAIAEVLPVTAEVKDVISSKKDWHILKQLSNLQRLELSATKTVV